MTDSQESQIKTFSARYIVGKILKIGLVLVVFYFIGLWEYLLFHSLIEIGVAAFSIAIFLLAWNSRKFTDNIFYIFIGSILLASASIIIIHALSYRGMNVFPWIGEDANIAAQLWLANQYLLAVGFLVAPFMVRRILKSFVIFLAFFAYVALIFFSIFLWKNFPTAYIEGVGLTNFKIVSEYLVSASFLVSAYLFFRKRDKFDQHNIGPFYIALALFAVSSALFTFYTTVNGLVNVWGHLIRLAAIYPIYVGVVEFGMMRPYSFLFGNLKARDASLKKSEKLYRAVVEDQTELICRFLPDGTLTFANEAYCRFHGKSREHLIGKKYYDFVPKEIAEKDKLHLAKLSSRNPVSHFEHQAVDKKGKKRWQYWTTRAIFDTKNKLVEFQSVGKDVTERKYMQAALHESEQKFRSLVDSTLVGVFRASFEGRYLYVNEAMARMFEFDSANEMKDESAKFRYANPSEREIFLKELREKKRISGYELTGWTKTGKKISVLSSAALIGNEITGMLLDITERKNIEKSKDDFISLASHQLRTPLSSIALSSELLLRGVAGEVVFDQKNYLEEILKTTKRMTLLVSNLLNVSRVEMGNFEVRSGPFDVASGVLAVMKEFSPLISEKNIRVEMKIQKNIPSINLDEKIFRIIFENIYSNAKRYTPAKGLISVNLLMRGDGVLLEVADTGCGIPRNQKEKIFSKSFRAENARKISAEGAGIGLYMAGIAAERSGAKIWFESEEGKGARFFVLFSR
jgi:PAS domain S-box-containing protein